jgi:hypothetical protein
MKEVSGRPHLFQLNQENGIDIVKQLDELSTILLVQPKTSHPQEGINSR